MLPAGGHQLLRWRSPGLPQPCIHLPAREKLPLPPQTHLRPAPNHRLLCISPCDCVRRLGPGQQRCSKAGKRDQHSQQAGSIPRPEESFSSRHRSGGAPRPGMRTMPLRLRHLNVLGGLSHVRFEQMAPSSLAGGKESIKDMEEKGKECRKGTGCAVTEFNRPGTVLRPLASHAACYSATYNLGRGIAPRGIPRIYHQLRPLHDVRVVVARMVGHNQHAIIA